MPKDKNNGREMTPDEKFRSFFSTTAVDIPEEMTRRDENQPEEKPQKRFGLFGRGKEKQETDEAAAEQPQEMPTGEVRLDMAAPGTGVDSYNVSVAAGIILYEIQSQRAAQQA